MDFTILKSHCKMKRAEGGLTRPEREGIFIRVLVTERKKVKMAGTVYEMVGAVKVILEPMSFPSGFTKREFVLTMEDDYPQDIKFACIKEKSALLDAVAPGDRVRVSFRIRGNLFKERYFVDLQAFRIEKVDGDGSSVEYDTAEPVPTDEPMPF